jgi:periplasmic protein TonB
MASRNKPYEAFGPYILFKKLETDSLGDLWRAGRIDNGQLGPTLAVRRLSGGNREALTASAHAASAIAPQLTGTSFVRDQVIGVADHVPFLAWDYQGGRSLRFIVDKARGGNGVQPNPLPIDQAIVIAEKVALSLATMADLRDGAGQRLWHGALLPQFVWISDDGEIRVAGQLLGSGLVASLGDQRVGGEIARYFAPESRGAVQPKNADVYSMGALLFLLVTGQEPPDAATASAFGAAVRAAKTMSGAPVPDDIRVILDKSFNLDPSMRYQSIGEMKQAVSALAHGGKYSATTFNLAFYLSSLLKKDMEAEAVDREKESKVNVAPYLEAPKQAAASAPAAAAYTPSTVDFSAATEEKKSKLPLAIAAGVVLAALGLGGWYMLSKPQPASATQQVATAQTIPAVKPPAPRVISEPIVVAGSTDTAAAAVPAATDSAAQQKAFEDAVKAKMQAEMMKLQTQFEADLKKSQPKVAPTPAAAPVQVASQPVQDDRPSLSAAQLDQQRVATTPQRQETPAQTAAVTPAPAPQTQTAAPAPQQAQPQPQVANTQPAPAPAASAVREGDVIGVTELDQIPRPVRVVQPQYPPLARSQRLAATIILSAFINENGVVTDVRVLRGEPRFGMSEVAVRAVKATRFSPPMKDGKKVKTWLPQQFEFKP